MEMLQGVWKQHLRPRAVVGYGVKIFLRSPPNYVTISPGLFCDYCFFLASFIVELTRCKWTGRSTVQENEENERCTVVCSRCR